MSSAVGVRCSATSRGRGSSPPSPRALETSFRARISQHALGVRPPSSSSAGGASGAGSSSPEEDPAANADVVRALCAQALANLRLHPVPAREKRVEPGRCSTRRSPAARSVGRDFGSRGFGSDPTALTHALWAVGVKGISSRQQRRVLALAEAASRATAGHRRAGAAGWCGGGRLRVPRPWGTRRRLVCWTTGAAPRRIWCTRCGESQMEGVTRAGEAQGGDDRVRREPQGGGDRTKALRLRRRRRRRPHAHGSRAPGDVRRSLL